VLFAMDRNDPRHRWCREGALEPVTVEKTDHYKLMREFCDDPAGFVEAAIDE
jgi:predicted ATPase